MKHFITLSLVIFLSALAFSQKKITDKHIINQQERMVFKQWDADKFTPKPGFLGLNPEYWITWALHSNYPKTDLRPLGPTGPQTQRLMFAAAMQNLDNLYKLQADTLRNTALIEASNYSSALSFADPLWLMYYRNEFEGLLSSTDAQMLSGLSPSEQHYLVSSGLFDWFKEESHSIMERLELARTTTLDRGSRIISYHRLLAEYRKLSSTWEQKKNRIKQYLTISRSSDQIRNGQVASPGQKKSDIQIANDILKKSKL